MHPNCISRLPKSTTQFHESHSIPLIPFSFLSPSSTPIYTQKMTINFQIIHTSNHHQQQPMAQRRKIDTSVAVKPDANLQFQHVAAEVAKLYQQSVNLQPVSFDAGRRHSLMKAYEWISSQVHEGKSVTSTDVITYVQNELNNLVSTDLHLNGDSSSSVSTDPHLNQASCSSTTFMREPGEMPQEMEEDLPQVKLQQS